MNALVPAWVWVCIGAAAMSCTDARLDRVARPRTFPDNKLEIAGDLCTRSADSRTLPLRVMFIVDSSSSMAVSDPPDPVSGETGRERAVRETWMRLLAGGAEGVRVGIIRFTQAAVTATAEDTNFDGLPDTYFTANPTRLAGATMALRPTEGKTNFTLALSEAYNAIRTELAAMEQAALPLARFVIVFLSDGIPDDDMRAMRNNTPEAIFAAVDDLRGLGTLYRVGELSINTALLAASESPLLTVPAENLLKEMARRGGGRYRSFASGEALNFLFVDFAFLRRVFTLKTLSAVNLNAVQDLDQVAPYLRPVDAGAPRFRDAGFVFPVDAAAPSMDAGVDAARPLVVDAAVRADVRPLGRDARVLPDALAAPPESTYEYFDVDGDRNPSCGEPLTDTDGDGVSDLTERTNGLNPYEADTDDDGLADRLEWRAWLPCRGRVGQPDRNDPCNPAVIAGNQPTSCLCPTVNDSTCFVGSQCLDRDNDGFCDCVFDLNSNGVCDCGEPGYVGDPCVVGDPYFLDCTDDDIDGVCDCPDLNGDHKCDYRDRDRDTLNDCEEVFYGSAQNGQDSDADGLPDPVEQRFDSNAVQSDLLEDIDLDRTVNGVEVLAGNDPWCDDSQVRSLTAYTFDQATMPTNDDRTCYAFELQNITLLPTLPNERSTYPGNGWNRILLFAGEVAFDDPNAFASYRVACVMANYNPDGSYRNPSSGRVRLINEHFVDIRDFDVNRHCVWP